MARNGKGDRVRSVAAQPRDVEKQIRERAHELFVGRIRTGGDGDEFRDWIAAEAQVLGKRQTLAR